MVNVPASALVDSMSANKYFMSMSFQDRLAACREMFRNENQKFVRLLILLFGNMVILPRFYNGQKVEGNWDPDILAQILDWNFFSPTPGRLYHATSVTVSGSTYLLFQLPLDEKLAGFARVIQGRFSTSEIKSLLFDLGLDSENFRSEVKSDLVEDMLRYLTQCSRLAELNVIVIRERPFLANESRINCSY